MSVLTGSQGHTATSIQPPTLSASAAVSQYVGFAELQPSVATGDPTAIGSSSQYSFYQQPATYQHFTGLSHFHSDHLSGSHRAFNQLFVCQTVNYLRPRCCHAGSSYPCLG